MKQSPFWVGCLLSLLTACTETKDGFAPVLSDDVTAAEKERFARRLYLDMTGLPPTDAEMADVVAKLDKGGNTADVRTEIVTPLVNGPKLPTLLLSEIEATAFSGQSLGDLYGLVCAIVRESDSCLSCKEADPCLCSCPPLAALGAERENVRNVALSFIEGDATTADLERALADTEPFRFNGTTPDGIATLLFQTFLGRPAEKDELQNARFMVSGTLLPENPAGLLFHRYGANYDDLIDIIFSSEVYRDAVVGRTFQRYLGRKPTADELRYFSGSLDTAAPDVRPLIGLIVSGSEYFSQ